MFQAHKHIIYILTQNMQYIIVPYYILCRNQDVHAMSTGAG